MHRVRVPRYPLATSRHSKRYLSHAGDWEQSTWLPNFKHLDAE